MENNDPNFNNILGVEVVKDAIDLLDKDIKDNNLTDLFIVWTTKNNVQRWRAFGNDLYHVLGKVDCAAGLLRIAILNAVQHLPEKNAEEPPIQG